MATRGHEEIDSELSDEITKLWNMDENCCFAGDDYEINMQGYISNASEISERDWAKYKFFSFFDEDRIFNRPTYKTFRALLDNYETSTDAAEVVTDEERQENWDFIDTIMETSVMQEAHSFLVAHRKSPKEIEDFRRQLYDIWFRIYKRLREDDVMNSSGFEHVFVGEIRDEDVIGMHNWLQIYLQEKLGNIDYRGYFRRGTAKEDSPKFVTMQFLWKGSHGKPIGSSFIGTSPEFEIALYTIMFLMKRGDKTKLRIADYVAEIHCYPHGRGIGTAYPIAK